MPALEAAVVESQATELLAMDGGLMAVLVSIDLERLGNQAAQAMPQSLTVAQGKACPACVTGEGLDAGRIRG